jgi:hypothetical protein
VSNAFDRCDYRQLSLESLDQARILPDDNILREQSVARENGITRAFWNLEFEIESRAAAKGNVS